MQIPSQVSKPVKPHLMEKKGISSLGLVPGASKKKKKKKKAKGLKGQP